MLQSKLPILVLLGQRPVSARAGWMTTYQIVPNIATMPRIRLGTISILYGTTVTCMMPRPMPVKNLPTSFGISDVRHGRLTQTGGDRATVVMTRDWSVGMIAQT